MSVEHNLLLPTRPMRSLDDYLAAGGGRALPAARGRGAAWVLDQLERAGLRGRGGGGFPTARKWRSVANGGPELGDRYVVANGAEGEPGTFKDRPLMRANPYQVLEGLSVAATVVRAREAFVAVKASFAPEIEALERALREMRDADLLCDAPVSLVGGPEEYLFGEEKALLEVIEGNEPMPRWLPPYLHGLFATTPQEGWSAGVGPAEDPNITGSNPTLVNNVESLANVPLILTRGAEWYRDIGTAQTPGPLICTVVGDVAHAGFGEIEPGTSLREVIRRLAGGPIDGRAVKAVLSGVSNPVLTGDDLDAPVSYEGLEAAGGGLGSAGFIVYDDTPQHARGRPHGLALPLRRVVRSVPGLQVRDRRDHPPPRRARGRPTRHLPTSRSSASAFATSRARTGASSARRSSASSAACCAGSPKTSPRRTVDAASLETLPIPKIVDIRDGVALYDEAQPRKQPDWTYAHA